MLTDRAAIERAVNETFPDGIGAGKTVGVVGVVDNRGVDVVASVSMLSGAAKVKGYYEHPWRGADTYRGVIMFSK